MSTAKQTSHISTAIEIAVNLFLIFIIMAWCLQIVSPFISIIVWAAVIAISMYKPFLKLQALLGGKKKLTLALFTLLGLAVVLVPGWLFVDSIVNSAQDATTAFETGEFHVTPPNESVKDWPIVGNKVYASWSQAASNFEAWLGANAEVLRTVVGGLFKKMAGIGVGVLQFAISVLIAMAFLASADKISGGMQLLFRRLVGDKTEDFMKLTTATVTSVTVGVLGISFIQAFLAGLGMAVVGVPAAGILALVVLIVCIAQLPPWLILFPVIFYVFSVESSTVASIFAVWAVIVSFLDMVLKPIFLGRGVEAPMLVILLGAIGGMIMSGIIGLFVGAIVLALGYKLLEAWLVMDQEEETDEAAEA